MKIGKLNINRESVTPPKDYMFGLLWEGEEKVLFVCFGRLCFAVYLR